MSESGQRAAKRTSRRLERALSRVVAVANPHRTSNDRSTCGEILGRITRYSDRGRVATTGGRGGDGGDKDRQTIGPYRDCPGATNKVVHRLLAGAVSIGPFELSR
jgi:hypothetical protein